MKKKILLTLVSSVVVAGGVAAMSAFEAHIINVTAHIENALAVHPVSFDYETVFPQEKFDGFSFFVRVSDSFSDGSQRRVLSIDYTIKQKPKPRPEYVRQVGADEARRWCHTNSPADPNDPADPYYGKCYPSMCPYISKTPLDVLDFVKDVGVPSFHDPDTEWATGHLHKKISAADPEPGDVADNWDIDLSVPCFKGQCAQDWTHPGFELPPGLEGQTFGCDLWIEPTRIY